MRVTYDELNDDTIKCVLYNKDGTVEYVFNDVKLNEVITPFVNETNTGEGRSETLFLSSS
jgi:hypothetical protein